MTVNIKTQPRRSQFRNATREKLQEKAMKIKMKEKLTQSICIRIQTQLKKTPEISRRLGAYIVAKILKEGLDSEPSHEDFVELVREAAKATVTRTSIPSSSTSGKSCKSRTLSSRERRLNQRQEELEAKARADVYMTEAQHQQASIGFKDPGMKLSPSKKQKADIWSEMVQYSAVEQEEKKQKEQVATYSNRVEWTSVLERQLHEKEEAKRRQKLENERYHQLSLEKLEKENELERKKEEERIRIAKEQHCAQEEQRRLKQIELDRQREIKAFQEERLVRSIQEQKERDEVREIARKEAERAKMLIVLQENEEWLNRKKQMKDEEREYERRLAEQYIKLEEKKDAARRRGLEEQSKRILAKMKIFDDTAKAEMDGKEKEEEMRCLKYQLDYETRLKTEEEKRKELLRERNRAQQEELKRQMELKKQKERLEKEEYSQQASMWQKECQAAKKKEKREYEQRVQRNRMQQEWLRDQMMERQHQQMMADHTALEMQLNKGILTKIQSAGQQIIKK